MLGGSRIVARGSISPYFGIVPLLFRAGRARKEPMGFSFLACSCSQSPVVLDELAVVFSNQEPYELHNLLCSPGFREVINC